MRLVMMRTLWGRQCADVMSAVGRLFCISGDAMSTETTETVETTESTETTTADDVESLKAELSKARDARKGLDKQLKEYQKELSELKSAGKTDAEKAAAERDAAKERADKYAATVRTANGREAVRAAAKEAGAPDPDLIYRLVRSDIDFDDDDEPTNIDRLVLDAKKDFADLFKVKPGKADAGGEGAKGAPKKASDMNTWIRAQTGR